jgi:D-alanyl-D-alanine carboxypeptidase (penicillin-binding protein 5/6)
VLENYSLNETVEVSKKAASTGGSRLGLKTGDKITVNDLLYGLMLCSGNDAAVCLAETVSGSIPEFADLMNKKAQELGLSNTHFESPHGLDSDEHYTTAYELAILSDYALQNSTFSKIVGTKNYTVTINGYPKTLSNTNELLGNLNGVYGIKTGFTNGANRCLVTACKRGDMDIICVVLGADTKNFRTKDSIQLIEYSFKTFEYFNIKDFVNNYLSDWKSNNPDFFLINKGYSNKVEIKVDSCLEENSIIPVKKDLISNIEANMSIQQYLQAPINEGDLIGNLKISSQGVDIAKFNLISNTNVRKNSVMDYMLNFFRLYPSQLEKSIF